MAIWRMANLGLAFLVELIALGVFAWWGALTGGSFPAKLALGIGTPLVAAVLWGLFAAPQATFQVTVLAWATKLLVFGGAAVALWQLDQRVPAIVFPVVVAANLAVIKLGHLDS